MTESRRTPYTPEFSIGIAIFFSLPLTISICAFGAPWLWDLVAGAVGWTGMNLPRALRDWFMERWGGLLVLSALLFSAPMAIYCARTNGHGLPRRIFLIIHLPIGLVVVGLVLIGLTKILFLLV
jgi:hypothetical protein